MTQKLLYNWEIYFKWVSFLRELPRAVYRTQPKVYGGIFFAKIANDF